MSLSSFTNVAMAALALAGCKSHHDDTGAAAPTPSAAAKPAPPVQNPVPPAPTTGAVPLASEPINVDGAWHERDWTKNNFRAQFHRDDGDLARPYSEVRFIRDDKNLYVGLYAADSNILSSDAFDLQVGPVAVQISAAGKMTPDTPDVKLAVDVDGTLDDPSNHDEEWKAEVAIPLAKAGLAPGKPVDVRAARCDIPKNGNGEKLCGEWKGQLTVE
jgi:hypothetical protein